MYDAFIVTYGDCPDARQAALMDLLIKWWPYRADFYKGSGEKWFIYYIGEAANSFVDKGSREDKKMSIRLHSYHLFVYLASRKLICAGALPGQRSFISKRACQWNERAHGIVYGGWHHNEMHRWATKAYFMAVCA